MSAAARVPHNFSGPYVSCVFCEAKRNIQCISRGGFACISNKYDACNAAERFLAPECCSAEYPELRAAFLHRMDTLALHKDLEAFLVDVEQSLMQDAV